MTQTDNGFKVSKKQWKKWSKKQRSVFNDLYEMMDENPHLFNHPDAYPRMTEHWKTTAWNAAWMAAEFSKET